MAGTWIWRASRIAAAEGGASTASGRGADPFAGPDQHALEERLAGFEPVSPSL